jgi:hypothetical protein
VHQGTLRYEGSIQEMQKEALGSGEVIFRINGAGEVYDRVAAQFSNVRQLSSDELLFPFADRDEVAAINRNLVENGINVTGIQVRGGLEEWFMRLTQNKKQIV